MPTVVLTLFPSTATVLFFFFFVFLKPVLFPQRYMFKSDKDVQERRGHLPPGLVYVQSFLRYLGGFVRDDASYECL